MILLFHLESRFTIAILQRKFFTVFLRTGGLIFKSSSCFSIHSSLSTFNNWIKIRMIDIDIPAYLFIYILIQKGISDKWLELDKDISS
ncbi:hypothetical protein GGQ94_003015 [Petrimonas sulfuriphila]